MILTASVKNSYTLPEPVARNAGSAGPNPVQPLTDLPLATSLLRHTP